MTNNLFIDSHMSSQSCSLFDSDLSNQFESDLGTPFSDSSSSDFNILELATAMDEMNESILLKEHGYVRGKIISETLQGCIFSATDCNNQSVAIKKSAKDLTYNGEHIDNNGFKFIVNENICKETNILKYLSNKTDDCQNHGVITYIASFESDSDYYLVMEHIESNLNLKDFVIKTHAFVDNGQLSVKKYRKIIRHLLKQIIQSIGYLHDQKQCSHLDLCPENVMLQNVYFHEREDGSVRIAHTDIDIKIIDFGVSEIYEKVSEKSSLKQDKRYLSIENEQYLAPNIAQQSYYNPFAADLWSFGMITYFCYFGAYPYKTMEQNESEEPIKGTGYWAIQNNQLKIWLKMNNSLTKITPKMFSLLVGLLNTDEQKRLTSEQAMQHRWFAYNGSNI